MNLFTPKKGIAVPGHKERTAHLEIADGPSPPELVFPMIMHSGDPADIRVGVGDPVKIGTLIGEGSRHISANIHSSVSGRVKFVEQRQSFRGVSESVVIENDGLNEEELLEPLDENMSMESFFERLENCGITGKGGAGFPSHVKFSPQDGGHKHMLINGAECEPYSTTDHRIMLEFTGEILRAMDLLRRLFSIEHTVLAIEKDKSDAIERFRRAVRDNGFEHIGIRRVGSRYPQGDQGVLLKDVFGLEIPFGRHPNELGVLTSNVSTIKSIYDALFLGRPLVKRVITITGPAIANPGNVMTRIGTTVRDLIDFCGGFAVPAGKLVNGGPMMGMPFSDLGTPVTKDTTTILCLGAGAASIPHEKPCIWCAKCVDVCPVNLQPILISNAYRIRRVDLYETLKAESCIRCGCCTYICPSNIPLLEDIKAAIGDLQAERTANDGGAGS